MQSKRFQSALTESRRQKPESPLDELHTKPWASPGGTENVVYSPGSSHAASLPTGLTSNEISLGELLRIRIEYATPHHAALR